MFAIVQLGNRQFKVKAGDFIRAPYQDRPVQETFPLPVLAFGNETDFLFDSSQLKKSQVQAVVVRQSLARKVLVFKKKRRKGYRRTRGHRQKITEIRILELKSPDGQISKVETTSKAKAKKTVRKKGSLAKKAASKKTAVEAAVKEKVKKTAVGAAAKEKVKKMSKSSKTASKAKTKKSKETS